MWGGPDSTVPGCPRARTKLPSAGGRALFTLTLGLVASATPTGSVLADHLFDASYYSFTLGLGTSRAALADLDGDGLSDVVATNRYDSTLTVRLGGDGGNFGEPRDFAAGDAVDDLLLADVNGDQKMDAIVIAPFEVGSLLGNGDGSFGPRRLIETPSPPHRILAADLIGDPNLDLAVAWEDSLTLLQGDGLGAFQSTRTLPLSVGSLAAADLNGDGRLDLVATYLDSVKVLLAVGDGTYAKRPRLALPSYGSLIRSADLNGDGRFDLVVGNGASILSIFLGLGNGEFAPRSDLTDAGDAVDFLIQDVDADRHLDLVVCNNYTSRIRLYRGSGGGTFEPPVLLATGPGPRSVMAADLNGDGRIDLATVGGYDPAALAVKLQNAGGGFGQGIVLSLPWSTGQLVLRDIDADGDLDLASTYFSKVWISPGHDGGSFGPAWELNVGTRVIRNALFEDLNGDGRLDLVVTGDADDSVFVLLQQAGGGFGQKTVYAAGREPRQVALGDVNSDGRADLVVANRLSAFSIMLGNGDGTFQPKFDRGRPADRVALADLNRDGKLDLVYTGYPDLLFARLGLGNASFGIETNYPTGPEPSQLVVADVNGDGRQDALVNPRGRSVSVYLGHGDGTFASPSDIAVRYSPATFALTDLDGDGQIDLAAACSGSGVVSIRLGNGDGTFSHPLDYGSVEDAATLAIGDVDGDGHPDVVVKDDLADHGTLLLNRTKITSIQVEDLTAEWRGDAIHLSWRLSAAWLMTARHVRVQRRENAEGPYADRWTGLAPAAVMECLDDQVLPERAYEYRIVVAASNGSQSILGPVLVGATATHRFDLRARRLPDGRIRIEYELGVGAADVRLVVFDVRGRRVRLLEQGGRDNGWHVCTWDRRLDRGYPAGRGVYLVRLSADGRSLSRKVVLLP